MIDFSVWEASDWAAWWGAIIASVVLVFDAVRWFRSGPKLRVRAVPNVFYDDSERKNVMDEEDRSMPSYELEPSIHLEIVNIGDMPTTLLNIVTSRRTKSAEIGQGKPFTPHFGQVLPHVLGPGEAWSGRASYNRSINLGGEHHTEPVFTEIYVSHREKPLRIELKRKERTKVIG